MKLSLALLLSVALQAATPVVRPLHVSPEGAILDDSGKAVLLTGVNRSGTGSGNADATATDADYAAQNQLLSMNLVRIFVNTAWWTANVQVPIANLPYQTYIDQLIQRAKKYGNYVLILKAGQFPDAPCGADGKNCPAPNQGDLNCQANASVCTAQDTTGTYIFTALNFWGPFVKKYGADPAILYDVWENMSGLDPGTWSNNENELIATIRTYNPQSLVFVEDTGSAFEAIAAGTIPDLAWSNLVWNFHLYNASTATCTEPASPRYANWSQKLDPLVSYAQQNGHAVAITEWGGCNDIEPYHTNITSYAQTHSIALVYFDSSNLITQAGGNYQLTTTGSKVSQAYSAIAAIGSAPAPAVTLAANAFGDTPLIAPNTWVEIKGSNLAPAGDSRTWLGSDFFGGQMPGELDGVSVTVNGKGAYVYFVSPTQVNVLTPADAMLGPVQVQLTNNGVPSNSMSVPAQTQSLALFEFVSASGKAYVYGRHTSDNSLIGPANLFTGLTTPVKPGEPIYVAGNGFGATDTSVVDGSVTQSGNLPPPFPVVQIANIPAIVTFAGLAGVGTYQINFAVPPNVPGGDQPITVTYNGLSTQPNLFITIQGSASGASRLPAVY
jgi:uncharacterized protein (TIGR03437 family)